MGPIGLTDLQVGAVREQPLPRAAGRAPGRTGNRRHVAAVSARREVLAQGNRREAS